MFRAYAVGKDSGTKRVASRVQGSKEKVRKREDGQHGVELVAFDWRAACVPGITCRTL